MNRQPDAAVSILNKVREDFDLLPREPLSNNDRFERARFVLGENGDTMKMPTRD